LAEFHVRSEEGRVRKVDVMTMATVAQELLRAGIPVELKQVEDGVVLRVPEEFADEADKVLSKTRAAVVATDFNVSADDPISLVEEFSKRIAPTKVPEDEKEYELLSGGGKFGVYDYSLCLWEAGVETAIALGMDPREAIKHRIRAAKKHGEEVKIRRIKARELEVEER